MSRAKVWYAVQVDHDTDCGTGSTVWREARKMATAAHKRNPGVEIGICTTNYDDDFCLNYEVIYEARKEEG